MKAGNMKPERESLGADNMGAGREMTPRTNTTTTSYYTIISANKHLAVWCMA
jgi:hypothetical protein